MMFLLINGCSNNNTPDNSTSQDSAQTVVNVKVDSIKKETLDEVVNAYGVTSARQVYNVISPVTGVISGFSIYNGDKVSEGETIAAIVPKEAYSAMKGAQAMLNNSVTEEQKKEAERAFKLAEQNANKIKLTAPFPGVLINRTKNENEVINEGELVASVINKNSIFFVAQVSADLISRIKNGQKVLITFPSMHGKQFNGTVRRIEPRVNMQSQTYPVQVEITNNTGLLADSLFGEASIIVGRHKNVFVAPEKAVIHNEEKDTYSVTLINSDSIAYTLRVTPGITRDSLTEIYSPQLKEGMPVIVEGNYGLPDSTKVSVVR